MEINTFTQFCCWRHEDEILQNCTTAEEAFKKVQHLIKLPAGKNHAVEIERAIKQIQLLQDSVMNNYMLLLQILRH